jgi:hypothetical protein
MHDEQLSDSGMQAIRNWSHNRIILIMSKYIIEDLKK